MNPSDYNSVFYQYKLLENTFSEKDLNYYLKKETDKYNILYWTIDEKEKIIYDRLKGVRLRYIINLLDKNSTKNSNLFTLKSILINMKEEDPMRFHYVLQFDTGLRTSGQIHDRWYRGSKYNLELKFNQYGLSSLDKRYHYGWFFYE